MTSTAERDWEDIDWSRHPNYSAGVATEVETIVRILNIAHVDTVNQSVYIKASLNLYWTDPRLAEREKQTPGAKLPSMIWGPWPELSNGLVGLQQDLLAKGLHDKTLGQMNAIIIWEGEINNPMNLRDFPFDLDFIDFIFVNERATLGLPGDADSFKIVGQMNSFRLTKLKPDSAFRLKAAIPDFCEAGEAPPFMCLYQWDGVIPEWNLVGYRERAATFPVPKGGTKEAWVFAVLIERKSAYYFWKAVLPLSLVMFFSCGIGIFAVDDLANRMSMGTTMFLASFATLYVVGAELPKTHFLTSIDQVVVATLLFLALMAANSWVCYSIAESGLRDTAEAINWVVLFACPVVYVAVVLMAFLPAIERKGKALRQVSLTGAMENASRSSKNPAGAAADGEMDNPNFESSTPDSDLDGEQTQRPDSSGDSSMDYVVSSFKTAGVLWTGSLSSQTGFEETESKVFKAITAIAGIPSVPAHEFHGMAGRGGAFIWLAAKCVLLVILVLMCMLLVPVQTMREAWFAPIMGVVACALPSSGMPVAGGIVFVPTLTTFGGMDARDAIAFTAATQMVGVGILAPLNWLFHDRRVFVRDGKADLLFVVLIPSWLGVSLTWLIEVDNDITLAVFTAFVFMVALCTPAPSSVFSAASWFVSLHAALTDNPQVN